MDKYCICFVRVSTEQQDYEAQANEICKEALTLGYDDAHQILIEYKESAITKDSQQRQGIQDLKVKIESNPDIDCVICWELTRMSRRADVIFEVYNYLCQLKIQWIVLKPYKMVTLNNDRTIKNDTFMMMGFFVTFAQSEMAIKKERFLRTLNSNKEKGKYHNGRVLRGYRVDQDKNFVIDDSEGGAQLIQRVFTEYIKGDKSVRAIAQWMIDEGWLTCTRSSARANVQCIINESRYCGTDKSYPAIISKEMFDKAQEVKKMHICVERTPNKADMLCKGIIYNKRTGYALMTYSTKHQYTSDSDYLPTVTVKQSVMDALVWEFSRDYYKKYVMNKSILTQKLLQKITALTKQYGNALKEIRNAQDSIDRYEEALILGTRMSEQKKKSLSVKVYMDYDNAKQKAHRLLQESQRTKEQLVNVMSNDEEVNLETLSFEDKRDIVKQIISKIYVDKPVSGGKRYWIEIHCKVDMKCYRYNMDSRKQTWELEKIYMSDIYSKTTSY